jgi:hypothetical protein
MCQRLHEASRSQQKEFLLLKMPANTVSTVAPGKVHESRHVAFPVARVWDQIRPLDFGFSSIVKDAKVTEGSAAEGESFCLLFLKLAHNARLLTRMELFRPSSCWS